MQQRVRQPHRGMIPSSSGQLPVPVALNAGFPTLFAPIIHDVGRNVKRVVSVSIKNIEFYLIKTLIKTGGNGIAKPEGLCYNTRK